MNSSEVLRIALPVPLPQLFDYLPPERGARAVRGCRILVPFGRRKLVGIVAAVTSESDLPPGRLVRAEAVLDGGKPLLDDVLIRLLGWCHAYYKHSPGEVFASALPPALRTARGRLPAPPLHYFLTAEGKTRLQEGPGRARVQHAMLAALSAGGGSEEALFTIGSQWRKTLGTVIAKGWVEARPALPDTGCAEPGPRLNAEQQQALDGLASGLDSFACYLLDGVTGSGKTEVYMSLIERVFDRGGQALVLVPEIGLTPQLLRRFRSRLGCEPAVIHSGLAAGPRLASWEAARSGRAQLVVGTRSALFTPMPKLGVIILDEEHDPSFKQHEGFRYSARDVAVKRSAELGIPVVLGSATPSLESLKNAMDGKYRWHRLRKRATRAALPAWRVLDLRQQRSFNGLAAPAIKAIGETLERHEQAMVFLNRRGYAPVLMCQSCGWSGRCERCDAHLTWHRSARRLCCHHCGAQKPAPAFCPECRADALMGAGEGTQQLEEALGREFAGVPVLRFDRDRTSRKGVMDRQLEEVRKGEPCLLVGTQMLAKGHHFPGVTLVVIVNIDQSLYSADFRALERMGQLILQVAGRAGRMDKPGTVLLQTLHPDHPALNLLLGEGYEAYAKWLLQERVLAGLPPAGCQALLRADAHDRNAARQFLEDAASVFPAGEARLFGPMPAIMERVGGRSRMYLMLQASKRSALHAQIDAWLPVLRELKSRRKVRWSIDIDPQGM